MASAHEQQSRIDHLEAILRERDRKEAEARTTAAAAQHATQDATAAAARVEAAQAEREAVRRGAWTTHLIALAKPTSLIDFSALGQTIPVDQSAWPPGQPETSFAFSGGTLPKEVQIDVSHTSMGKLLNNRRTI